HLDRRLMDFARLRLGTFNIAGRTHIQPLLDSAARNAGLQVRDPSFLWTEWEAVIDAWGLESEESYLNATKEDRGLTLTASARQRVWPVFAATIAGLSQRKMLTWAGLARMVATALEKNSDPPYTHIVADEAQDFGPAQLKFLRSLGGSGSNGLTLVADPRQR